MIYFPSAMARHSLFPSLFVLKVLLNTKQTSKQIPVPALLFAFSRFANVVIGDVIIICMCVCVLSAQGECVITRQLAASIIACSFLGLFPRVNNLANFSEILTNIDR